MTEKCHHKPGPYNPFVSVRNKYETALEKAIINKGFSRVGDELIYWLDGELPIEPKRRNYKRLDLLGKDASGKYVLCELKFSGTGTGNKGPVSADNQLIEYKNLIQAYGERFGLHSNRPHDVQFDLSDFLHHKPRLMVVADATYWDRWKGINARRAKKRTLNEEVEHYSIDISADDLEQQKLNSGKDNKYKPELPERAINWKFVKREELIDLLTSGLTEDEKGKLIDKFPLYFCDYRDNLYFRDLSEIAKKAFNAGSGQELKLREDSSPAKASALHSSSMLACNFFDWINWSEGYEICIEGHKYSKAYFEVKIPTLAKPKPTYANMDVMLVSKDGKRIAFIESKFTEHFSRAASELYGQRFASAYANDKKRYYKECCAEKWVPIVNNWKGYAQNGKVRNEAMSGYYNGIKQDICHLIAIGNLKSSPAARKAFATKNKKTFGDFDISGNEDFDFINLVYEPNEGKYSKEYKLCGQFKKLCQKLFDDVQKTIKTVPKFCTYSELWKDNSSMMSSVKCVSSDETLKKFLERRYMQFSSVGE